MTRCTFFFSLPPESVMQQPIDFILLFVSALHCISHMVHVTMMPLQEEVLGLMNYSTSLALFYLFFPKMEQGVNTLGGMCHAKSAIISQKTQALKCGQVPT